MNSYINEDFLLTTDLARQLYHEVAENLPIIDYHNHLDPQGLAENRTFADLSELWINADPYKHRLMRIAGVQEEMITGKMVSNWDRYTTWISLLPRTIGSPLFHWSYLELKHFFGVDKVVNEKNAKEIWDTCNAMLRQPGWGMLDILKKCNVETLCTSDDLLSDVTWHEKASQQHQGILVKPSLRADSIIAFPAPSFQEFISKLSELTGVEIAHLEAYLNAIQLRLDVFHRAGCEYADHSLDSGFSFIPVMQEEASSIFDRIISGQDISHVEVIKLQSFVLSFLGHCYAEKNWAMQLHMGAKRDTNTRLRRVVGVAGGYATIGTACDINSLVRFLDTLDREERLPRTILFTLNPADNAAFATLTGSYSENDVWGKVQFGPAWWYNDHMEGITQQLETLSSYGLLSSFIGMTTDSRSVLSFSRHEYFRRVLCRFIANKVEQGEYPGDISLLENLIKDICYRNCKEWRKQK